MRASGVCARVMHARRGDEGCGEFVCASWTVARARCSIGVARVRIIIIVDPTARAPRGFRGMRARDDARAMERDDRLTRRDGCTIQGVATLAAAKPSFAAYGESANVFGGISNPTGARDTIDIALEIDSVWVDANECE